MADTCWRNQLSCDRDQAARRFSQWPPAPGSVGRRCHWYRSVPLRFQQRRCRREGLAPPAAHFTRQYTPRPLCLPSVVQAAVRGWPGEQGAAGRPGALIDDAPSPATRRTPNPSGAAAAPTNPAGLVVSGAGAARATHAVVRARCHAPSPVGRRRPCCSPTFAFGPGGGPSPPDSGILACPLGPRASSQESAACEGRRSVATLSPRTSLPADRSRGPPTGRAPVRTPPVGVPPPSSSGRGQRFLVFRIDPAQRAHQRRPPRRSSATLVARTGGGAR